MMELQPLSADAWQAYVAWHALRKLPVPPRPLDAMFVSSSGDLLAGVGMYPTEANYCLIEHLATSTVARLADRHRAVVLLASAVRLYCTARGKFPLMVIRSRSIGRILQRAGYVYYPGAVFSAPLGVKL